MAVLRKPYSQLPGAQSLSQLRQGAAHHAIDINLFTEDNRLKTLLLADMDATIIRGESLDELAALCGKGEGNSRHHSQNHGRGY